MRAAAASGLAEVSLGPATQIAALPDPFPFWRGGALARRPRRVRNLGRAQRRARQRHPAVHRPVAVRARGVVADRSVARLVGKDGRARQGHRHRSLLRHLREFARQLLRLFGPGVHRSRHGPGLSPGFPGPVGRRHRARRLRSRCARSASSRLSAVVGASLGGMVVLAFAAQFAGVARRVISISGSPAAMPFAIALRSLQRDAILTDPDWQDGQYSGDVRPDHRHAPRAQARHDHLSLGRRMEASLRPPPGFRPALRSAAAGARAFPGRIRGAGLPRTRRPTSSCRCSIRTATSIYRAPWIASISRRTAALRWRR